MRVSVITPTYKDIEALELILNTLILKIQKNEQQEPYKRTLIMKYQNI